MNGRTFFHHAILATPAVGDIGMTPAIRASLLSRLFEDRQSLIMAAAASAFVSLIALIRLHQAWAAAWFAIDVGLTAARLGLVHAYWEQRAQSGAEQAATSAARYAPLALAATVLLGLGACACVMSGDSGLDTVAIMVAAGTLGGIASKNAALPRLAKTQICLGAIPIALGALFAPHTTYWILVPPLFLYVAGMVSIVRRHYESLVALMTAEQKHARLAAQFDAALTHMPQGLCTVDESGYVQIANSRTAELFGARSDAMRLNTRFPEFIGQLARTTLGGTLRLQLVARCAAWLSGRFAPLDVQLDDERQLEMTRNPVPDGSTVIIIEDVTERRRAEQKMLHWARHDPLTGLPNRRDLRGRVERLLSLEAAHYDPQLALMYLDLDGFKNVNDTLGHYAGDEVLKSVAGRLAKTLRKDTTAARIGGDELAVAMEQATGQACIALAERIIARLSASYTLSDGATARIGVSIGIAFATRGESFESLLKRADEALYAAKAAGKGTYRFASSEALDEADEPRLP
ncbi:sensor domain-containing diguanylate cyclase [Paraburkholderia sp.]|uniref:sensor domain-containing diguanylate cyclase n=1 Tax=Paraburkholderia sp. TaxID=1926495 RepID=UPI00238EFA1F|nr:sensor domain-containing diguanylate cyclase [Paraburkholderia sp.]MDE1180324.1 diguanylate cyclase [Paraburkholderia sp.]